MIPADRKGVAITAKHKHMQIRPAQRNTAGKGQRPAVDEMDAVGLDKIGNRLEQPIPATVVIFSCQSLRFSISLK
jgi:hypothetical protein